MISRSPDLQRLRDEGYNLRVVKGTAAHLLVSDVPYVNSQGQVCRGIIVAPLTLDNDVTVTPLTGNHQTWFIGEHPCNHDGTILAEIKHQSQKTDMGNGIVSDHSFSSKPLNNVPYRDYHEKMTRYIDIISAPAKHLQPGITAKTFPVVLPDEDGSTIFCYADTASARSGIGAFSESLAMNKVAIIGLGGTGSYVLDLVAKTHVQEIHLYDGDKFHQHNAFRAPGAAATADFTGSSKVAYFAAMYGRMRKGIFPHEERVTDANVQSLASFDFVFICIDNPNSKEVIVEALCASKVPFIDVGMDVQVHGQKLDGFCRTTLVTPEKQDHIADQISFAIGRKNELYASNIQTADMNCLNATLAVIKWKQFCGFYHDYKNEHFSLFTMSTKALAKR